MSTKEEILSLLETHRGAGVFRSGTGRPAEDLPGGGVEGRQELQKQGHSIEAVPNKGYTMRSTSEVLSEQGGAAVSDPAGAPAGGGAGSGLHQPDRQRLAAQGAPPRHLVVADAQTGGRGRRGRSSPRPRVPGCI